MTEQTQQLNRVAATTKDAILDFMKARLASGDPTFTSDQLRFYVTNNVVGKVSPSSADRVLRLLRQQGMVDYYVVNRGRSLYKRCHSGQRARNHGADSKEKDSRQTSCQSILHIAQHCSGYQVWKMDGRGRGADKI